VLEILREELRVAAAFSGVGDLRNVDPALVTTARLGPTVARN
jgi:hypothetical protein